MFQIFALYIDFERCKEHACPLSPIYGLWLGLEVPDWGLASWSWFGYGHWFFIYLYSNFWLHLDFLRCREHPWPLNPDLKLWWGLEVPDWCLTSWSWFGNNHWSLIYLDSEFGLSNLNLKLQRIAMSFRFWLGALVGSGGSWLGFGILMVIWIWLLVFGTLIFWILALYLNF